MNVGIFRLVPLPADYGRKTREQFNGGSVSLDGYFREVVTQDIRRRLAKCFIALGDDRVSGFYTLAAGSIALEDLPEKQKKRLRYEAIPVVRIGRLAVDLAFRNQGLGSLLLYDAFKRVDDSPMGAYAVIVDAKDDMVKGFYLHHGFTELPQKQDTLFLPVATVSPSK